MSPRRASWRALLALPLLTGSQALAQEATQPAAPETVATAKAGAMTEPAVPVFEIAEPLSADKATEPSPSKHYWRALVLEAMAIGGGTTWYWIDRDRQVADWDFPTWRERLTLDVMRYDNNPFHVNFAWHAGNGAGFHVIARSNGLGFYEAVGYGALTSILWEYALEYREKVSVNDLIFTTGAGVPLGEFIHAMGSYFNRDPKGRRYSALRWTLGFPQALVAAIDGAPASTSEIQPMPWHDFHLGYELGLSRAERAGEQEDFALHSLHIDGRLVRLPGYHEPGAFSQFFQAAQFNHASFDASGADGGSGFKLFADATLLGYYQQQIHRDSDFISNSSLVGIAMAYRYRREQIGLWDDRVSVLHFPGPAAEAHVHGDRWSVDMRARANIDFAGINALANAQWEQAHPDEHGKAILRKMGYYYGYGTSASGSLEARYADLVLGGEVWAGRYQSDEGLDRTQEDVTLDQHSEDTVVDSELHLRLEGLPYDSYLGASYQYRSRSGVLEEFSESASLHRVTLAYGFRL